MNENEAEKCPKDSGKMEADRLEARRYESALAHAIDEQNKQDRLFVTKCSECKKTITAEEGRFLCPFCHWTVCEECAKGVGRDKGKQPICWYDLGGMFWLEGRKTLRVQKP